MKAVVLVIGSMMAALGVIGLLAPEVLFSIGRQFATPIGLFVAALLRVVLGLIFIKVAVRSRFPLGMRVLGVFVVVAGLVTPLFGVERARALINWWSERGPLLARLLPAIAAALGVFVVYAMMPRRRGLRLARSA